VTGQKASAPDREFGAGLIEAWGTFDVANYGDLLFPLVLDRELAPRVGAEIRLASPHGGVTPAVPTRDVRRIDAFTDSGFYRQLKGLDGIVLGGGDTVQLHDVVTSALVALASDDPDRDRPYRYSSFLLELGFLARRVPVAWNAVGVPSAFDRDVGDTIRLATQAVRYLSVRDETSKHHLEAAGVDTEIHVVPDSAVLVRSVFSSQTLDAALERLRRRGCYPAATTPTLAVQWSFGSAALEQEIAGALNALLDRRPELAVVLVPLGRCHGDDLSAESLARQMPRTVVVDGPFSPEELTAAISGADAFVGSSVHGNIAAAAFGVPGAFLAFPTHRPGKLLAHARLLERSAVVIDRPDRLPEVADALLDGTAPPNQRVMARLAVAVHEHFDRIAAALSGGHHRSATSSDPDHQDWVTYGHLALAIQSQTERHLLRHVDGLEQNLARARDRNHELAGALQRIPSKAEAAEPNSPGVPKARVSVVLPLFNGSRHLREALESIVCQTEPPHELVIVDDGSTDLGLQIVEGFSAPFPIRVFRQNQAGQSAARNYAVSQCDGELIAFLDQDDTWHPMHLAALCQPLLDDPTVGWVYGDYDEIDLDGHVVTLSFLRERSVEHPKRTLEALLTRDLMVIPSASILRRSMFEALGGFDETLHGYEDDDLVVRAFRSGWGVTFHDLSLARFRVHAGSSSTNEEFLESRLRFSEKLRVTVADDRRLNRYYLRDVVVPRFFRASLDDYVQAVSTRDWQWARRARFALRYFADQRRDHAAIRWKLWLIHQPRLFRWMLRANGAFPLRVRPTKNPILRLR
jgi:glycosyltransferase involved in cell wall biosynthesis/polysaccharide pyruvyl transferase WcaK-like protein